MWGCLLWRWREEGKKGEEERKEERAKGEGKEEEEALAGDSTLQARPRRCAAWLRGN